MPGIVLAAPGSGPPIPPDTRPWTHMLHRWVGWDGATFDLCSADSGVALMAGVRGMTMPPVDRFTSVSPAVAGSRWRGTRTAEREVFWPVKVWNDQSSQEWTAYDRAWWNTMRPDQVGTWVVTQPDGSYRSLRLRFVDDGSHSFDTDPSLLGWARYGITLVAEDPYWSGQTVRRSWEAAEGEDFFGGSGGPPLYISAGNTLATATLTNPGDVEAWPVWQVNAPFTEASVGLDGQTVEVPFSMSSGYLTIDTDPRAQTAITNLGVDRTSELGEVGFAPIPAGQSVPLSLALTGLGSVSIAMTPRWYRAW